MSILKQFNSFKKKGVGVNYSNCDSSTRDWSTLFGEKQLLNTKIENCLNWINRIRAVVTQLFATVKYKSSNLFL